MAWVFCFLLLSFFPRPPTSFPAPDRGNVPALSEKEKNWHVPGSENINLIVDGLMLPTTNETGPELEVC